MKIYFATWTEANQGETLTKVKGICRLISYYFWSQGKDLSLKKYVLTGLVQKEDE